MLKPIIGALLCVQFVWPLPAVGAQAMPASATESSLDNSAEPGLNFSDAARKTLRAHPQFRQLSLALAAAQAREAQATLKPELELSGGLAAQQNLQSAIAEEHVIRDHQLAQAKEVRTLTLRGYEIGRYAYRDVALAQSQVQTFELKPLNAAQAYHLARIEIGRLTGAPLNLLALADKNNYEIAD